MSAVAAPFVGAVLDRIGVADPIVVVAGDLLLDRWWLGGAERMTREAPAPVVTVTDRLDVPGGAANTAMNLAALGSRVRLVGAVGDDEAGARLLDLLGAAGVDTAAVLRVGGHLTTTKTRIAGGGQLLVRLDEGDRLEADGQERIAAALAATLPGADAVVVCDYDGGTVHGAARTALERLDLPPVSLVDAHDLAPWRRMRPTVVTPNAREAERLLGVPRGRGADRAARAEAVHEALLTASGATGVVVTLDRDGSVVHTSEGTARTVAHPAPEAMANGAGDTFAAALTLALVIGEPLAAAALFAQLAADVVVRETGTTVCTAVALRDSVADAARVLDAAALVRVLAAERAAGRRIVFTNGCFDVLHLGHTAYLKQARALGDLLVVAVNDDDSVRRLKGPGRPINGAADRAGVIAELACVDYVTVFPTDTPIPLLEAVRPDVYAKGGDYTPQMLQETPVVTAYGGSVRIVDWVSPHSTSGILARARAVREEAADG